MSNNWFDQNGEWHWFTGGLFVSLLSMFSYVLFEALHIKKYAFGITAGYGYVAAKIGALVPMLMDNPIIKRFATEPAALVEFSMLIGMVIGAYVAAKRSETYSPEVIPATWKKYHGESLTKRLVTVLIGGFLLGLGATLGSGCTTGNILQGWAHLSLGSLVAGVFLFIGGILTAKLLFRNGRSEK